jgi:hypothetical protein
METIALSSLREKNGWISFRAEHFTIACRGIGHEIVVQAFIPLGPVI